MEKEGPAASHKSTATTSEQVKGSVGADSSMSLEIRKNEDVNLEFERLMASVSDSSEDLSDSERPDQKEQTSPGPEKPAANRRKCKGDEQRLLQDVRKCANASCSIGENGEKVQLAKAKFKNEVGLYCEKCALAIKEKWICPFCQSIYTEESHSNKLDKNLWVQCDLKKCSRWTHLECEERHRAEDLKSRLLNPKYKFYCSECICVLKTKGDSPNMEQKKKSFLSITSVSRRESNADESLDPVGQFFQPESRFEVFTSSQYFYLYSDNYQYADRLVCEKLGRSLNLNDSEICEDFDRMFQSTGDKRFIVAVNSQPVPINVPVERSNGRKKQYKSVMDNKYPH